MHWTLSKKTFRVCVLKKYRWKPTEQNEKAQKSQRILFLDLGRRISERCKKSTWLSFFRGSTMLVTESFFSGASPLTEYDGVVGGGVGQKEGGQEWTRNISPVCNLWTESAAPTLKQCLHQGNRALHTKLKLGCMNWLSLWVEKGFASGVHLLLSKVLFLLTVIKS